MRSLPRPFFRISRPMVWLMFLSMLVCAFFGVHVSLLNSLAYAQPQPKTPGAAEALVSQKFALSGLWVTSGSDPHAGGIIKIAQRGSTATGVWVRLAPGLREIYGFEPNEAAFKGTLQGNRIVGTLNVKYPLRIKTSCPKDWQVWVKIEMTVAKDGNQIEVRWDRPQITGACKQSRLEWARFVMTRQVTETRPELRFVREVSGRVEPIDAKKDTLKYGEPFFVEARFETAPSQPPKTVTLEWGTAQSKQIEVKRTSDPKVFRSGTLYVEPPTTAEAGGAPKQ